MIGPPGEGAADPPRVYGMRELCNELEIGMTQAREWVGAYEALAGPLPRAGTKPNAARLVPTAALEAIREARAVVAEHPGRVSLEEALRGALRLDPAPLELARPEPPEGLGAVLALLAAQGEELAALRAEVTGLRAELAAWPLAAPSVEGAAPLELPSPAQVSPTTSRRPKTLLERVRAALEGLAGR